MSAKNKKAIILLFFLVLILTTSTVLPQYDPQNNPQSGNQILDELRGTNTGSKIFEDVPLQIYIKIDAFGTVSLLIVLLAFLLGLVSFFMGWNAGGRQNKKVIRKSIISGVAIAIIARPFILWIHHLLERLVEATFSGPAETLAMSILGIAMYVIWSAYLVSIPVFLYEVFTVTAKEAYPPR